MAAEVHLNERVNPRGGSPLTSFAGAVGVFRLFLRETVVSAMIHGHVFSVTLLSAVVGAADVGASWVGLLCLCGWGGQTQMAAGRKEQLDEDAACSCREARNPSVSLSMRAIVARFMHEYLSSFVHMVKHSFNVLCFA